MIRTAVVLAIAAGCGGCKKERAPRCPPSLSIEIPYFGASPAEVESQVLVPIEHAVASSERVGAIHGLAKEGGALLEVEVRGDVDRASRELFAVLEKSSASLPAGVEAPLIRPVVALERMILGTGPADPERVAAIERALEAVAGVRSVSAVGARAPEVHVRVDPHRLAALGIDGSVIGSAARSATGDLGEAALSRPGQPAVKLADVATITETFASSPAVYAGGQRVALFVIAVGDRPADPDVLASAGLERATAPFRVASCPRGLPRRLAVTTAVARDGAAGLAAALAKLPVVVLDGIDLTDRGVEGVEVVALGGGDEVHQRLLEQPGLVVKQVGVASVEVELSGDSLEELMSAARSVQAAVSEIEGAGPIEVMPELSPKPELRFKIDRAAAKRFGISTAEVGLAVRRATNGEVAAIRRSDGVAVPIRVFIGDVESDPMDLTTLPLVAAGGVISLGAVVQIQLSGGVSSIYRRDMKRQVRMRIYRVVAKDVESAIAGVRLPASVAVRVSVGM